jgi:hypothetical protein
MIPENWRKELLKLSDIYCKSAKISEATLGNKVAKDADFFPNIRKGSGCNVDTYRRILLWFSDNLPKTKSAFSRKPSPKINISDTNVNK